MMRRTVFVAGIPLILAGLLAAGCWMLAPTPGPPAHLRALSVASLTRPGAILIGLSARDQQMTFDGPQPAVYTRAFGTQQPATAVEIVYAGGLPFAGWTAASLQATCPTIYRVGLSNGGPAASASP